MSGLYAPDTVIAVTTVNGVYTGTFLGIRQHEDPGRQEGLFLHIRLTGATATHTVGEVIAINLIEVVAIGPVAAP